MIYFDNAASTKVDDEVVSAMLPYFAENYGNPSSIHELGRKSRAAVERARKTVARQFNVSTSEIFFTSGGTESNNMVLKNCVRDLGVTHIISSKIEHHCVLHTCDYLSENGVNVQYVDVNEEGYFDLTQLKELLQTHQNDKVLVSLIHANNEIGTINDWVAIGNLCRKYGALYHADTVQTVAHYTFDLQSIPVDFISAGAHKFHGPKGVGFLYMNADTTIHPLLHGGAQERNMRAGTENLAGIVGLAKALEIAYEKLESHKAHLQELKSYTISALNKTIPNVRFNGDISDQSLYTVLNVTLPISISSDMLLFNLDIAGICVSAGSACSSGADKGSHVIQEIHKDNAESSIRISFSKYNKKEEVDEFISTIKEII